MWLANAYTATVPTPPSPSPTAAEILLRSLFMNLFCTNNDRHNFFICKWIKNIFRKIGVRCGSPILKLTVIWHWANMLFRFGDMHSSTLTYTFEKGSITRDSVCIAVNIVCMCNSCDTHETTLCWCIHPKKYTHRNRKHTDFIWISLFPKKEKQNTENYSLPVRGDACKRYVCVFRNTLSRLWKFTTNISKTHDEVSKRIR